MDLGSIVIVNVNGLYQIGMIAEITGKVDSRTYTVYLESGSVFTDISIDNKKVMIFIDSKMTQLLINKLNTKLSYEDVRRNVTNVSNNGDTENTPSEI